MKLPSVKTSQTRRSPIQSCKKPSSIVNTRQSFSILHLYFKVPMYSCQPYFFLLFGLKNPKIAYFKMPPGQLSQCSVNHEPESLLCLKQKWLHDCRLTSVPTGILIETSTPTFLCASFQLRCLCCGTLTNPALRPDVAELSEHSRLVKLFFFAVP